MEPGEEVNKEVFMQKFIFILMIGLLIPSWVTITGSVIKNPDQPQKGKWNCNPEKAWEMDAVGDDVLGDVRYMKVDQTGNLYLAERIHSKFYVLDPEGKLIVSFGRRGEGPGEFKRLNDFHIINDYLIVPEMANIHYLSKKGVFIKDVNPGKILFSRLFIDENRLVKLSYMGFQDVDEPNYIEIYNLETKKSKKLVPVQLKEGVLQYSKGSTNIVMKAQDTKPEMVFATDSQALFYGNNDLYQINKIDFNGKPLLSFSVEGRKKNSVSRDAKLNHFRNRVRIFDNLPKDAVKVMLNQIPDQSPYFLQILIDKKGRIYVLLIDLENQNQQAVDIFSPAGKYLYHTVIDLSENFERIVVLAFSFARSELFAFAEDEEGERLLVKYKINLPD
jgi:hypothetical protein